MRIALVAHGFPPEDRTGVENYTASLAAAFARAGHAVDVFAPRRADLPELSVRREERDGYAVHWLTANQDPRGPAEALERPGAARRFAEFLDRERPEVVHFQHVVKLGVGLLRAARDRGLAVVYTAHDYYPVCHRYTLLRPDLSTCDVRGDAMACALCDVALGFLNEREGLGDYQAGVLEEQLSAEDWRGLRAILADDPEAAGLAPDAVDDAFDRRLALDAERARGFAAVDLFLAPTRFLANELVRGGIERERIEVLPYGIENEDLRDVAGAARASEGPVRFGYFGGLSKHKGVQLLIEAFADLHVPAELSIWGYSTDAPHVEGLRAAATAAGARWRGPYERAELPALLAQVDVVVVPSLWVENYPIVIREAFSARRPVVAWDFGALAESVRHGVDGLLVEAFDVGRLTAALAELAGDPDRVRELAGGIEAVKTIAEQADELIARYRTLLEERRAAAPEPAPLPSLRAFVARREALEALPNRELLGRVLAGLDRLRAGFGGEAAALPAGALLERGLAAGARAQDELRASRPKLEWLEESLAATRDALAERAEESEWRGEQLAAAAEELAWRRYEQTRLEEALAEKKEELDWRREEHERARAEAEWLRGLVTGFVEELASHGDPAPPPGEALPAVPEDDGFGPWLEGALGRRAKAAELQARELAWRRAEMEQAAALSPHRLVRLVLKRLGLGRRLAGWSEGPWRGGGA